MRNWHTKIIKLDKALNLIQSQTVFQVNIPMVGIVENYIEYDFGSNLSFPIAESDYKAKSPDLNFISDKKTRVRTPTADKNFFSHEIQESYFFKESFSQSYEPSAHTTSLAGILK